MTGTQHCIQHSIIRVAYSLNSDWMLGGIATTFGSINLPSSSNLLLFGQYSILKQNISPFPSLAILYSYSKQLGFTKPCSFARLSIPINVFFDINDCVRVKFILRPRRWGDTDMWRWGFLDCRWRLSWCSGRRLFSRRLDFSHVPAIIFFVVGRIRRVTWALAPV